MSPNTLLVGMSTSTPIVEDSMEISQKSENKSAIWPILSTPENLPKGNKSVYKRLISTSMLVVAQLTITKIWDGPYVHQLMTRQRQCSIHTRWNTQPQKRKKSCLVQQTSCYCLYHIQLGLVKQANFSKVKCFLSFVKISMQNWKAIYDWYDVLKFDYCF